MIISDQIKLGRKKLGMSQSELADTIWVSRNTISNWENGSTTPDIQSLILMSALFGITLDEFVKGDAHVMAHAIARDKNHILLAGNAIPHDEKGDRTALNMFSLRTLGTYSRGKFDNADITGAEGLAYRLIRVASFMSRSLYFIVDSHEKRVGSITRKHALQHPVYHVRMTGFECVQIRRETRLDRGYRDVIRFDGEGIQVDGNLMGDDFSIWRHESKIACIHVHQMQNRIAYSIDLPDDGSAPLALGVTIAVMMLRDYDRVWIRGSGSHHAS